MKGPVSLESLTPEDRAEWFAACKAVESWLKKQFEILRPALLEDSKNKGGEWSVNGCQVSRSEIVAKLPDEQGLLSLLQEKGIDPHLVFEQFTMYQINPSRLEDLVHRGVLTREELAPLIKVTERLEVTPSKEMKNKLTSNMGKLLTDGK